MRKLFNWITRKKKPVSQYSVVNKYPLLTSKDRDIIRRWVNSVETGSPEGNYSKVSRFYDGPGGKRQITYGRSQTTEAGGNLGELIDNYLAAGGKVKSLKRYHSRRRYGWAGNTAFAKDLEKAGKEKIMQQAQDDFFDKKYFQRAYDWGKQRGFVNPYSYLVLFDSFIHSGSIPMFLRKRFAASPSDEKSWITQYVNTRHKWLANWGDGRSQKSRLLRTSSYRTRGLKQLLDADNWNLEKRPIIVNGIKVI